LAAEGKCVKCGLILDEISEMENFRTCINCRQWRLHQ
jgi:hypothetical protein